VRREDPKKDSLQKFDDICAAVKSTGHPWRRFTSAEFQSFRCSDDTTTPFGEPSEELRASWMDYHACRCPDGFAAPDVAAHFAAFNKEQSSTASGKVITYSHFLPRIDLMPEYIPSAHGVLYPVLGSVQLERQLRRFNPSIHVYGHSHVNRHAGC
jgi:hypothetical protein